MYNVHIWRENRHILRISFYMVYHFCKVKACCVTQEDLVDKTEAYTNMHCQ